MAFVKMSFAGPGATCPRLSIRVCVVPVPIRPSSETSARIAGKIARIP